MGHAMYLHDSINHTSTLIWPDFLSVRSLYAAFRESKYITTISDTFPPGPPLALSKMEKHTEVCLSSACPDLSCPPHCHPHRMNQWITWNLPCQEECVVIATQCLLYTYFSCQARFLNCMLSWPPVPNAQSGHIINTPAPPSPGASQSHTSCSC